MLRMSRGGIGRLGRLAVVVVLLDLAIVSGVATHLAGGRAEGALLGATATDDPVTLLGTRLGETGCPKAPLAVGEGLTVVCPDWTAIVSDGGRVQVISLYGPGDGTVDTYRAVLPQGLHWGDSLTEVVAAMGQPKRITSAYQTPTLVYMFRGLPYGALELRFSRGDRLQRINACLER